MKFTLAAQENWGRFGLRLAIGSAIVATLLSLAHGLLEYPGLHESPWWLPIITWCVDMRYVIEQLIYVGAIVFVGAKFFETRTIFTVGFDRLDAAKVAMKGPDDDNVVWIGQRYPSRLEAETVAAAIEERLKPST